MLLLMLLLLLFTVYALGLPPSAPRHSLCMKDMAVSLTETMILFTILVMMLMELQQRMQQMMYGQLVK